MFTGPEPFPGSLPFARETNVIARDLMQLGRKLDTTNGVDLISVTLIFLAERLAASREIGEARQPSRKANIASDFARRTRCIVKEGGQSRVHQFANA